MLRMRGLAQQLVNAFIVRTKHVEACEVANDKYNVTIELGDPILRGVGCVELEHQPEATRNFLISLVDNHGYKLASGRRVAFLAVVSGVPSLPTGVGAHQVLGMDFVRKESDGRVYRATRIEGEGNHTSVHLSIVEPRDGGSCVELYSNFIQTYTPEV